MIKIIYMGSFVMNGIYNGPQKAAEGIFNQALKTELDAYFISYLRGEKKYSLREKLFGYLELTTGGQKRLRLGIIQLIMTLYRIKPEIIHILTFERLHILPVFYCLISGCRLIYNVSGIAAYEDIREKEKLGKFCLFKDLITEKFLFNLSDYLVFHSHLSVDLAKKYYSLKDKKIKVIPHGIEESLLKLARTKSSDPKLRGITVAEQNHPGKGLEFLMNMVMEYHPHIRLTIIGDKKDELLYENYSGLHFKDRMNHSEFIDLLLKNDIYICPCEHESFSISSLEAMALGLVPVLSSGTGLSEYLHDNKNGFIFKQGDGESLYQKINLILKSGATLSAVSCEAKNFARRFTWGSVFIKSYLPLYK